MKDTLARFLLSALRAYIRYFPVRAGKRWVYKTVVERYLSWRDHSAVVRTKAGPRVGIRLPDQIQDRIYFFGVWEPDISAYIRKALAPGDCFIDVGANIGYFSLLAASVVGERGRVIGVEASPTIFGKLSANIRRNHLSNVTVHNKAASDKPGTLKLFRGPAENCGATTTVVSVATRNHQEVEAEIPADTLQAIVGDALFDARLIKVDVEGAEFSLVSGIADQLHKFSARTEWLMEVSPQAMLDQGQSVDDLFALFRDAGYRLYKIRNDYGDGSYFAGTPEPMLEEIRETPTQTIDVLMRYDRAA